MLLMLGYAFVNRGTLLRKAQFYSTGTVAVDDFKLELNPKDDYLTWLVLNTGDYEPVETAHLKKTLKPGDTFVDVGANIGWYTILAAKLVGPEGKVYAFEPEPENFKFLKRNVELNGLKNVVLEQKALSNEVGTLKMYLHEENQGRHSIALVHDEKRFIEVEAFPFDEYVKGKDLQIDFMKIDTEGAEGFILDGMKETLSAQSELKLIMEFSEKRLAETGYEAKEIFANLTGLGFEAFAIDEFQKIVAPTNSFEDVKKRLVGPDPNDPYVNLYLTRSSKPESTAEQD